MAKGSQGKPQPPAGQGEQRDSKGAAPSLDGSSEGSIPGARHSGAPVESTPAGRGTVSREDFEKLLDEAQGVERERAQLEERLHGSELRVARMEARIEALERECSRERKTAGDLGGKLEDVRGELLGARAEVARKEGELVAVGEAMSMARLSGIEEGRRTQLSDGQDRAGRELVQVHEEVRALTHRVLESPPPRARFRQALFAVAGAAIVITLGIWGTGELLASERSLRETEVDAHGRTREDHRAQVLGLQANLEETRDLLEASSLELAKAREDATGLRARIDDLVSNHPEVVDAAVARERELQARALESAQATLRDYDGLLTDARAELRSEREARRASESTGDRLRGELDSLRMEYEARLAELNGALDTSLARQRELLESGALLQGRIGALEAELARLRSDLERAEGSDPAPPGEGAATQDDDPGTPPEESTEPGPKPADGGTDPGTTGTPGTP